MMMHAFIRTHICRYLNEEESGVLMENGNLRRLAQGDSLFNSGDLGDSFFVILQGRVHVYQTLEGGVVKTICVLGYGSIIGEVSMIDRQSRSASAAAMEDAALFELSRAQMVEMIRNHPGLASKVLWAIMETITVRLRDANLSVQSLLTEKLKDLPKAEL